jgi:hypothetical protein
MDSSDSFGLDHALQELSGGAVLGQLCQIVTQVRRANADRQEVALGDDAVSLATLNWRNIVNQLERHFDGRATVKAVRPRNSFQLLARGYTVNVYGVPVSDPNSIVWKYSGIKQELAAANSAMAGDGTHQTLTFDDALFEAGLEEDNGVKANHVVIVHWADADASTVRMWAGLPRDNWRGGSPWLELLELTGYDGDTGGSRIAPDESPDGGPAAGFQFGTLPEVTIEWAPAAEPDTGSDAAKGGA